MAKPGSEVDDYDDDDIESTLFTGKIDNLGSGPNYYNYVSKWLSLDQRLMTMMMTSNQSNQLNSLVRNECNLGSGSIIINKGSEFDDDDIKSKQSTQFTGKKNDI